MRVIKDDMVNLEAVLKRWKDYIEKLMNEENNRDPKTEEAELVKVCVERSKLCQLRRIKECTKKDEKR